MVVKHHKITLCYKEAKHLIQEADVLLFRGRSLISYFIGRAGETSYTHVGVASWVNGARDPNSLLELVEFREAKGGRSTNLEVAVTEHPFEIDVYRPIPTWLKWEFDNESKTTTLISNSFNGKAVTRTMRKMTGLPYGYKRIWWMLKHKLVGWRLFYKVEDLMADEVQDVVYPVCSTAVAYSFNVNGYDLIHNRSDEWTEPGQIAESARLSYLFTLCP